LSLALGAATQANAGRPSEQTKLGRATCFLNEIHHPQADKIAKATVFIAAVAPNGTLASEGTGSSLAIAPTVAPKDRGS